MNNFNDPENYTHYIIEKYSDMLIRISYSYIKNLSDAEDITQDIFIRLLQMKPNFESTEHEKAWLIRVCINLSKDKLKSTYFKKTAPLEGDFIDTTKEDDEIIHLVLNLPIKYRSIILLYYYEDYSISEISDILNIKKATVGSQLSRARKLLKPILKEFYKSE